MAKVYALSPLETCTERSVRFMSKLLKILPKFTKEYLDWTTAKRVVLPNLKPSTKTISLRLPQHLLDSIKAAANSRDVPYQ